MLYFCIVCCNSVVVWSALRGTSPNYSTIPWIIQPWVTALTVMHNVYSASHCSAMLHLPIIYNTMHCNGHYKKTTILYTEATLQCNAPSYDTLHCCICTALTLHCKKNCTALHCTVRQRQNCYPPNMQYFSNFTLPRYSLDTSSPCTMDHWLYKL